MSLADEVREEEALSEERRVGGGCGVALLLSGMSASDRKEWAELLASSATSAAIHRVMRRHGMDLSASTLKRHRSGECRCGATA